MTVTATQTDTGLVRSVVSDENGGYLLTNLPVGPYRLEFTLTGFRTFVQTGLVGALTSGWQIAGIVTARSGSYYTVNIGADVALSGQCCAASGAPHQRANQVLDDPFMPNRTYAQWLNPAAFQRPAEGAYGTMPLDAIQGSHRWNVDASLSRSFGSGGRQVQVRLEAFNLFNTLTPGIPQTTLSSSDFGRITSIAGAPRILQLGIKYQF